MDGRRLLALAGKLVEGVAARAADRWRRCARVPVRDRPRVLRRLSRCLRYLDRIGFAVQNTPAAHLAVQYALNNSRDATLVDVSNHLDRLHRDRRSADYELKNPYPETLAAAKNAVELAASVIARLDDVRDTAPPDRTGAIAVAVSDWLKSAQSAGLRQKSGTN